VLETVRPAIDQNDVSYIDLRGGERGVVVGACITERLSAGDVNRLKDQLAPLLFGAAWKTIDLLLEFALSRAGLSPSGRDWLIAEKKKHACTRLAMGLFLDARPQFGLLSFWSMLERSSIGTAWYIGPRKWIPHRAR
jgi:hypothetical protein